MPGGDRTGPAGLGPRSGRALGYCAGFSTPGYTRGAGWGRGRGFGRGLGRGYGRGLGRGWGYIEPYYVPYAAPPAGQPMTSSDQVNMLKQEKEYLESEMKGMQSAIEDISRRITELESKE
jgi:hypothetical protein